MTQDLSTQAQDLPPAGQESALTERPKKDRPELSAKPVDKKPMIIAVIIAGVLVLLLIGLTVLLFMNPQWAETLSYIATFYVALLLALVGLILMILVIVLIYVGLKINDLTQLLGREVQPILTKAQSMSTTADETAKTVQSRVNLVSNEFVKPVIAIVSFFSGIRAVLDTLFKRK